MKKHMAIAALAGADEGTPPDECPIGYLVPDNRRAYVVPHSHRWRLAMVVHARGELNGGDVPQFEYAVLSRMIAGHADMLDREMRLVAGVPPDTVIEYHDHWYFTALTRDDIIREHLEFEAREAAKGRGTTDASKRGVLDHSYLERPAERCHLWEYMSQRSSK